MATTHSCYRCLNWWKGRNKIFLAKVLFHHFWFYSSATIPMLSFSLEYSTVTFAPLFSRKILFKVCSNACRVVSRSNWLKVKGEKVVSEIRVADARGLHNHSLFSVTAWRNLSILLWGTKAKCWSTLLWGAKAPVVANNAYFALSSQTLLIRNVPSGRGAVFVSLLLMRDMHLCRCSVVILSAMQ